MIKVFGTSQILKKDEFLNVRREGAVTYPSDGPNAGKPQKFEIQHFTVRGNVQPMSGRDLMMVPEHDRFKEQYWLYINNSQFAVKSGFDEESIPVLKVNDIIIRLGVNFQVQSVQDCGSYVKCQMMRIDIGPYATPGGHTDAT